MRVLMAMAIAATAAACGSDASAVKVRATPVPEIRTEAVPVELNGLRSAPEDVSDQLRQAQDRAFVDAVRMWSLREGDRLRSTVEVARFKGDSRPSRPSFQRSVVAQIGQSAPRLRRVGQQAVYVTTANKQALFIWFREGHLVVLSTSTEYKTPRALLRAAVEQVDP